MTTAPQDSPVPADVCAAIRSARRIAVAGHVTPDADCVGAIGAMCLALPELGATPLAVLPKGSVARKLEFLANFGAIEPASEEDIRTADLLIALDTAKEPRLNVPGGVDVIRDLPVVNIDHHATNTQFGRFNWIDGRRSSTCEMVFETLVALGCQITPTIATLLFAGIHSDTQGFSLSNTTARSLQVGAELARAGADMHVVGERLHRSMSRNEFELLKTVYGNTQVTEDGCIAWSTVDYDEIIATGCNANDIDSQVEAPRSVEGINIAMLLSEGVRGKIRVNFRGEQGLSVLELARQFGGGGHHAAAGAIIEGPMDCVAQRVVAAARDYVASSVSKEH